MAFNLGLYTRLYMPLCRAYARRTVGDRPADPIMAFLCGLDFLKVHGYRPRFKDPRTFEEKLCHRMLYDRNPLLTFLSDKLKVRDHIARTVGHEHLVPLIWSGDDPEEIPFSELPQKYVIKTNHGCGYNIIVKDGAELDKEKTKNQVRKWLSENYCQDHLIGLEWAYKNINPTILVESFLDDHGKEPVDFKFFCFSGRSEYLQMNFDRFSNPSEKTFDRELRPLDLWQGFEQHQGPIKVPHNISEMLQVAESLAGNLDFIRVDMYNVDGRIFIGELTCYPGGGRIRWIPRTYDYVLGDKWKVQFHPAIPARGR